MFMGCEFGQWHEWREYEQLDWPLLQNPKHRGLQSLNRELAKFYRSHPQLHASDCEAGGFRWIDLHNADESVFAFLRLEPGHAPIVCVFNATPVPREDYWLGVPEAGRTRWYSIPITRISVARRFAGASATSRSRTRSMVSRMRCACACRRSVRYS